MEPEQHFPSPSLSQTRWWSKETVAVVTGGNKGIGFSLVKRFAELGLSVVLTARDKQRGEAALETLKQQGFSDYVHFLLLDVSDPLSISTFASSFRAKFGPTLDILVYNEVEENSNSNSNSVEHAESVMRTNFYGPKLLVEALLPLFRCSSSITRVLNISSRLGSLNKMRNREIKKVLEQEDLSEEEVSVVVEMFLGDVREGRWKRRGWPAYWTDYAVSKLALNAYSRVLAKRYSYQGSGLSVNCFCPGFTQTSMTKGKGTHTPDHAAARAATLALLPPHLLPTGKFFSLRTTTSFLNAKL
ncbi:hypothetical protein Fmac_006171 [Flemingia macrophylla]|uniref:Uncharacterized protein n=1 Tax=Flemingia macrophylla TaxID=520843 RepID=A0ABD1N9V1_9FABA